MRWISIVVTMIIGARERMAFPRQTFVPSAVMVWLHGGGFFMGSGTPNVYGPEYLMDYDVVLVTVNYR
jgi:carboxylesterase type B